MKQGYLPVFSLIFLCVFSLQANARWEITPRVRVAESYTDNLQLSDGDEDDDFITEINPGISVVQEEGRVQVDLDYEMQNVFYADHSSANDTFHNLNATGVAEVLRNHFFVDMDAKAGQRIVSTRRRIGTQNVNDTGNLTDEYKLNVTPRWVQNFGNAAIGEARYQYGLTEYSDETDSAGSNGDVDDNTHTQAVLSLQNFYPDADFTWLLLGQRSHVDYEDRSNVTFKRASVDLGYRVLYPLRIVGEYGVEDNNFDDNGFSDEDPNDDFWNAGFIYDFNPRSELEVRYGDRFFGNTLFGRWEYTGPRLELLARYEEDISTGGLDTKFTGGPDIVNPTQVNTNTSNENSGVYELQSYNVRAALNFSKSTYSVFFSREDRNFLTSTTDEEETRFHLVWDWEISGVSSLKTGGYWQREDSSSFVNNSDDTFDLRLRFDRKLSPRATFDAQYIYSEGESDLDGDYTSNLIGAGLTYEFR